MKKIAVTGTHSVGKSTLCYSLALEYKKLGESVHIIQERVRFSPLPINTKMTIDTAIWACTNQISKELEAAQKGFSILISDRTPLDTFAYAKFNNLPPLPELEQFAIRWLNTYNEIYFVRPALNHRPATDGIRDTDLHFVRCVDEILAELLNNHPNIKQILTAEDIFDA